jgi:hypothetical protein
VIQEPAGRQGVLGYARSALEALLGASTEIGRLSRDPADFDVVVVGSPIWAASVSSPVRTYLWLERSRLRQVAFFVTHGGTGDARALGQMREVTQRRPAAELVVREREIGSPAAGRKIDAFVRAVAGAARRGAGRAARRRALRAVG